MEEARGKDKGMKQDRQDQVNASKYKIQSEFQIGDAAMLRNYRKSSKFDPIFLPEHCEIVECSDDGRFLTIEIKRNGRIFERHPDDVKGYHGPRDTVMERNVMSEEAIENGEWHRWFEQCRPKVDDSYESGNQDEEDNQESNHVEPGHENGGEVSSTTDFPGSGISRRSQRLRKPNPRYIDYEM